MKLSCLILTHNEADRIDIAITHALQWADEVVVLDKQSTDRTRAIALDMGARVETLPFSRQGHENLAQMASCATHDWVWCFTPGEVPTEKLIAAGKALMSDDIDAVLVPHFYYAFGSHQPTSPWSFSGQPRLYNRTRVTFTGISHDAIRAERVATIEGKEDCYVLHQTHSGADSFLRVHADYALNEGAHGEPRPAFERALLMSQKYDKQFAESAAMFPHMLGWKIYWFSVALHAWERSLSAPIKEGYRARALAYLKTYWRKGESP